MEPLESSLGTTDDVDEDFMDFDPSLPPLDRRVINVIKSCPDYTIRPARLSSELGSLSVDDACAELCGLLSAVGGGEGGATFSFEKVSEGNPNTPPTMVFTFPPDFEQRALRSRRKQDLRLLVGRMWGITFKVIKIVTAFGLVLSLLILTIAGMVGLVAAVIAMSRGGGGHNHHRSEAMRRLRSLFFTLRQLLWCYALFGANIEGQDPFLREIAMDMALFTSVCCGNPGSLFFWLRASQLSRRRARYRQGWGRRHQSDTHIEGVSLTQQGTWGDHEEAPVLGADRSHRGLLSVAVEFLFGPTPFQSGPSEADRWKIRAAAIVELASVGPSGVSLKQLSPFTNYPPSSIDRVAQVVAGGLEIVAHFNGVPIVDNKPMSGEPSEARFAFPELLAENSIATRFEESPDFDDGTWENLLYAKDLPTSQNWARGDTSSFLYERRYVLTRLEGKQFFHCVGLGVLNAIGVAFFRQALEAGGMLSVGTSSFLAIACKRMLVPVLQFYAVLFFVLLAGRLLVIVILNAIREERNRRRAGLAKGLNTMADDLSPGDRDDGLVDQQS